MLLKKIVSTPIAVLLCLTFHCSIGHADYTAIVIDADNGKVLHETAATKPWFPASLTKVMTLYLTFDALKKGLLNLQDNLQVSSHAAHQPNSKLGLQAGEVLTVKDAILAVISRSANDAAVVLAEKLAGTEAKFANNMTTMARRLNMHSSTFFNATGLPHSGQISSSRDMAILASHVRHDFKDYFPFFSTPGIQYNGHVLPNINSFLNAYPGAEGMKTGFTCASGYNLMAAAHRNGRHLIGIVMGAYNRVDRNRLMTDILDKGFASTHSDVLFDSLDQMAADPFDSPHFQLPAATCHYDDYSGFAKRGKEIPHVPKAIANRFTAPAAKDPAILEDLHKIKNWTVVLGAFNQRQEAEELNQTIKGIIGQLSDQSYPIVIQHQTDGLYLWHALWTGLSTAKDASKMCKNLWENDIECSVLPPEVIVSAEEPWR